MKILNIHIKTWITHAYINYRTLTYNVCVKYFNFRVHTRVEIKQIIKTKTLILWDSQGKEFWKFPSFRERGQFLSETRPGIT